MQCPLRGPLDTAQELLSFEPPKGRISMLTALKGKYHDIRLLVIAGLSSESELWVVPSNGKIIAQILDIAIRKETNASQTLWKSALILQRDLRTFIHLW